MGETLSAEALNDLSRHVEATLSVCGNCAQTSFSVLQDAFGLEGGPILKALTPFPGIALRGETCGAVTGSLMAIGLVQGRDRLDDWKGFVASLPAARRFCRRFEEQQGATSCNRLLEIKLGRRFNLADRGEAMEYLAAGGREACRDVIANAVQIAAQVIVEKRPQATPRSSPVRRRLKPLVQRYLAELYVLIHLRRTRSGGV